MKNKINQCIEQLFLIYGGMVFFLLCVSYLVDERAGKISTLFVEGKEVISLSTLSQYFLLALVVTGANKLLLTEEGILKKGSETKRTLLLFLTIGVALAIFIISFKWIPLDDPMSMILTLISFGVSMAISVMQTAIKERKENLKMEKALHEYKRGKEIESRGSNDD